MTNAGKKHKPVGISKRTDKRAGTFYTRSLILIKLFDSSIDKHSGRIPLQPSRFQRLADHAQCDVTSTAIRIAMLP